MVDNIVPVDFSRRRKPLPAAQLAQYLIEMLTSDVAPEEGYVLTHHDLNLTVELNYDPETCYETLHNDYVEDDKAFGDEGLISLFASQETLSADQMRFLAYLYQEVHVVLVDRLYFNTLDYKLPALEIVCCHNNGHCVGVVMRTTNVE